MNRDGAVKECLRRLAAKYINGCVAYFETCQPPNTWEQAFEKLDHALKDGSDAFLTNTLVWFEQEISRHIEQYAKLQKQMELVYGSK